MHAPTPLLKIGSENDIVLVALPKLNTVGGLSRATSKGYKAHKGIKGPKRCKARKVTHTMNISYIGFPKCLNIGICTFIIYYN